eukprot:1158603-Pelagomonas_calceolata.AAC.4
MPTLRPGPASQVWDEGAREARCQFKASASPVRLQPAEPFDCTPQCHVHHGCGAGVDALKSSRAAPCTAHRETAGEKGSVCLLTLQHTSCMAQNRLDCQNRDGSSFMSSTSPELHTAFRKPGMHNALVYPSRYRQGPQHWRQSESNKGCEFKMNQGTSTKILIFYAPV